ncbi:membrane protein [Candidatus Magnetomorum sp. HK-1]|nr:membrane protein [Candidatus Magnetomorum sp. HK-1]
MELFIKKYFGDNIVECIAFVSLLLITLTASIIFVVIINKIINKLDSKKFIYTLVEDILKEPVLLCIVVILTWYIKKLLPLAPQTQVLTGKILLILSLFCISWLIVRFIKIIPEYIAESFQKDGKISLKLLIFSKLFRVMIWIIAIIVAFKTMNYETNTIFTGLSIILGILIALISVFGISIAMAATDC